MSKSVEGIYRDGKVELLEMPEETDEARVIVTFLPTRYPKSNPPVFTEAEIAELRGKLAAWEEDWNAPGMEIYGEEK